MNGVRKLACSLVLCFVALVLASAAQADYYWLLEGTLNNNAGSRSDSSLGNGTGCYLKLTNDTESVVAGVDYKPVRVYDIRRTTKGGTTLAKYNEASQDLELFEGCRYGEAVIDFSLPIYGADGTVYTLVTLISGAFKANKFVGKIVLTNSISAIGSQCFQNCIYLKTVVFPDPTTWQPTELTRLFEGCTRLEGDIIYPDSYKEVTAHTFSACNALKGFSGKGVKTYTEGCFHNIPATFRLEMSEAETISFTGEAINNDGRPRVIIWHKTPPSTGDYFSSSGTHFMKRSSVNRVHYIPYDATQEGGVPARWAAYKTDFEAETSGNSLTFPTYDAANGTQTDGSWYTNGRAQYADRVRFYFPDETAGLLMK